MQMLTVKIAAAIVLTASGFLAGRALSSAHARRAVELRRLRDALTPLRVKMLHESLPLSGALRATRHEALERVAEEMEQSALGSEAAWTCASAALYGRGGKLDCLIEEDRELLGGFFAALGSSGSLEQEELLQRTASALEALEQSAGSRAKEIGRLYTTLGALGGMALSIALL